MTSLLTVLIASLATEQPSAPLSALAVPIEPAPLAVLVDDAPVYGKWTGSVSLSASYADGNTNKRTASASVNTEYRADEANRYSLAFLWNYAQENGAISQRQTQGRLQWDHFFTKRFYGLLQGSAENDFQQTLDLRTTIGAGVGYQFFDDADFKLAGEVGLSYVDESYKNSADDKSFLAARLAEKWEWKASEKFTLSQVGELFPSLETSDDITARVDTKAKLSLTAKMFAQLEWLYQWNNSPASGKDRVDNLILLGVGWSF